MARLFVGNEIIDNWNPLDDLPPPDFIPSEWNGLHVARRLSDAWKTLSKLPSAEFGPRAFGRAWPQYRVEWDDLLAMISAEGGHEIVAAFYRNANRVKLLPSSKEISEMEKAMSWPMTYLNDDRVVLIVNVCARMHAFGRDLDQEIKRRKYGGTSEQWQKINWNACDEIADALIDDKIVVF